MLGSIIFSLIFIAIGAGILFYARKMYSKAQMCLSWPTVQGEIAHSTVLTHLSSKGHAGSRVSYKADIVYRYRVNDVDYSSSTISVCDATSGRSSAQTMVERYSHDAPVKVYYNSNDPSDALLEPNNTYGLKMLCLIGGGFALAGASFLMMSLTGQMPSGKTYTRL